ncbi:MAG: PEP-CTERM sorting domain-containing protein, partial [Planctomycetia bacterium]
MLRRISAVVALVVAGLLQGAPARADLITITSGTSTIGDYTESFSFDFNNPASSANLAMIQPNATLIGVETYYTFTRPGGNATDLFLNATLKLPAMGDNADVDTGFFKNLEASRLMTTASATNYSFDDGLLFSTIVRDALLTGAGVIDGVLSTDGGPSALALDTFFMENGGTITATLTLVFQNPEGPGGSGEVPEPASLLLWGAAGVGYLVRRKRTTT